MRTRFFKYGVLLFCMTISWSCEFDTKLRVTGANPPVFEMTGNGALTSIRIRGHKRQREAPGEDAFLYWVIVLNGKGQNVGRLGSVTDGQIPDGYRQKYPESGSAPVLDEGQPYHVQIDTNNANGDDGCFMTVNGKVVYAKNYSELPEDTPAFR